MAVTLEETIDRQVHESRLSWLLSRQTFWVLMAAVVAFVVMSIASDVFATQQNLFNVTRNFAFVGIIALGISSARAAKKMPKAAKVRADNTALETRRGKLAICIPRKIKPISSGTNDIVRPKAAPDNVLPKIMARGESGAPSNRSNVLVFLSNGSTAGPIEPPAKNEVIAARPGMSRVGSRERPMVKAK